jgi:hypothetical protein
MRFKSSNVQCRASSVDSTPARFGLASCATGCVAKRAVVRCLVKLGTGSEAVAKAPSISSSTMICRTPRMHRGPDSVVIVTAHRRGLFSERAHCWTSANSKGWAIPRAVYEFEIKGRLRVRIQRGILIAYSQTFPTFAAAGKSLWCRRWLFVRALCGGRAAQRLASAGLLCYRSVW